MSTCRLKAASLTDCLAFRSLVCATAQSSTALIIGRAIAGAGVAGVFTGSIMVVVRCGKSSGGTPSMEFISCDNLFALRVWQSWPSHIRRTLRSEANGSL